MPKQRPTAANDSAFPSTRRRSRYAHLSAQELNLELRRHTARTAMAFFDRLPPEERERVRDGISPIRGYTWQLQGRDGNGRFQAVDI